MTLKWKWIEIIKSYQPTYWTIWTQNRSTPCFQMSLCSCHAHSEIINEISYYNGSYFIRNYETHLARGKKKDINSTDLVNDVKMRGKNKRWHAFRIFNYTKKKHSMLYCPKYFHRLQKERTKGSLSLLQMLLNIKICFMW